MLAGGSLVIGSNGGSSDAAIWIEPRVHPESWGITGIYGGWMFLDAGDSSLYQFGAHFLFGDEWIARPAARAGILIFPSGGTPLPVFGGGVDIGRRFGGTVTFDVGARNGVTTTIFRLGGYWAF